MKELIAAEVPEEIRRPARAGSIPALVRFVCNSATEMGFPEGRVREIAAGLEEALGNIVQFACADGEREIVVQCSAHEMGALILEVRDSGRPFNMLVATSFPQAADFLEPGQDLSTRKMKKAFRNIEYRRDGEKGQNILLCVISK